jgi:hypothetical protein
MDGELHGIHRRIPVVVTEALTKRFWNRVNRNAQHECWPWLGAQRNGYGAIKHEGKVLSCHVVSYVIHNGSIPHGLIVTHSCDNRICCNPTHLTAASFSDNVRDMMARRKISPAHGIECYNAILSDDVVREIRRVASDNKWGARRTAKHLELTVDAVKGVLAGKTWKHVV